VHGFFDPIDGSPKVQIEISGIASGKRKTINALLDTGHNGSLSLSFLDLIEIGAALSSYGEVCYASGHRGIVYYFTVNVTVDGKTSVVEAGMIENPDANEAIAGLQLFAPYVSFIDFKNKTVNFLLEEEWQKIVAASTTSTQP
jgi:predicted aspartyl protease